MAELTKEEALSGYAKLYALLETGNYEELDPNEEYADEEEVIEGLDVLRSWARKQDLCFTRAAEEQQAWKLEPADEDTKATWQAETWIHRHAGLAASFMWQDDHFENGDDTTIVDATTILGMLPHKEDEPRTWVVRVDGTSDSGFGYSHPNRRYLTIRANPEDDKPPIVAEASDEQVRLVSSDEDEE